MSDFICGLILMISSLPGVITFYKTFKRRKQNESAIWLLLLAASTVLWVVTYALFFLLPKEKAAIFFHEIRYSFVMLSSWFIYLFIYRTLKHRMFTKHVLILLFLFPILNTIVILTNRSTHIFISYFGITEQNGLRAPLYEYGPWFIFHCAFSYIPHFLGALIIINQFIHLPPKHKPLVGMLLLGMIIVTGTTMLAVFDILPYPVDLSPIVIQATQAIFYYTLFNSRSLDMIFASRNVIFENSNSILLVLDTGGTIVDYNRMAGKIAERIKINDLAGMSANSFVEKWQNASRYYIFEEDPTIFSIIEDEIENHYQVQTYSIWGEKNELMGSYMEIKNIKPIMSLIHMLQDVAYYDNLTGLPNRNYFAKKSVEIDKPESYPLCIVVGDVNGLKHVNDTYGHVKGDELLKLISSILLTCAPKNALFSRSGGDEFIGLIPNTTAAQAIDFINRIEDSCCSITDPLLKSASISLGFKIKTMAHENTEELIKAADQEMYTAKRDRRVRQDNIQRMTYDNT